ncbi:Hypothetical_protein [Hexamita inflata]|uniref:Hypothetical_protein n=1 Tax=Hexamita inflata TaxID=28002 RepID=A0AA86NXT8_9EUKA|nr:Hypothetical protein HINF_LOCUS14720 [Hexamita inflata]
MKLQLRINTENVQFSGSIVGNALYNTQIIVQNICQNDVTQYSQSTVQQSGIFGSIQGKIYLFNAFISTQVVDCISVNNYGTIGELTTNTQDAQFTNLNLSFKIPQNIQFTDTFSNIGSLVGYINAQQVTINQSCFNDISINASINIGGVFGTTQNTNIIVISIMVQNTQLMVFSSIESQVGGLSGISLNSSIQITNLYIKNIYILSSSNSSYSYCSGLISHVYDSLVQIRNYQINNSTILSQSIQSYGYSAGAISNIISINYINSYIQNSIVENCNITSFSCIPRTGGFAVMITNTSFVFDNVHSKNSVIFALGNEQNSTKFYWGILGSILAYPHISKINLLKCYIFNIKLTLQSTVEQSSSSMGTVGYSQWSTLFMYNIEVYSVEMFITSTNNSYCAGIIGYQFGANQITSIVKTHLSQIQIQSISAVMSVYSAGITAFTQSTNESYQDITVGTLSIFANSSCNNTYVGGISGYVRSSFLNYQNIVCKNTNISAIAIIDSVSGGCFGIIMNSIIQVYDSQISNNNISSLGTQNNNVGGVIGYIYQSSSKFFISQIHNINITIIGTTCNTASFVGQIQTFSSTNIVSIQNSVINSVQFQQTCQVNQLGFVSNILTPDINKLTYEVKNCYSKGFSSSNNVQISNCPKLLVTLLNGAYIQSSNGC